MHRVTLARSGTLLAATCLLSLGMVTNAYLTITTINDGDTFAIGKPFFVDWNDAEGGNNDARILALLRCSTSWLATEFCDEVTQLTNQPKVGHQSFTANQDLNDGAFYRFQLLNTVTMQLATSGTFMFLPAPVDVNTT